MSTTKVFFKLLGNALWSFLKYVLMIPAALIIGFMSIFAIKPFRDYWKKADLNDNYSYTMKKLSDLGQILFLAFIFYWWVIFYFVSPIDIVEFKMVLDIIIITAILSNSLIALRMLWNKAKKMAKD
jgi:hypothetical protein